ncbi:hypothetical protein BDZ91DRAFT_763532 [Kalaharituber pfeilii]|nr:hypothetical protein BDZ91DRAFT_763532 [Kalaharituber pfeilii]
MAPPAAATAALLHPQLHVLIPLPHRLSTAPPETAFQFVPFLQQLHGYLAPITQVVPNAASPGTTPTPLPSISGYIGTSEGIRSIIWSAEEYLTKPGINSKAIGVNVKCWSMA